MFGELTRLHRFHRIGKRRDHRVEREPAQIAALALAVAQSLAENAEVDLKDIALRMTEYEKIDGTGHGLGVPVQPGRAVEAGRPVPERVIERRPDVRRAQLAEERPAPQARQSRRR